MSLDRLFSDLRPEVAGTLDAALSGRELSVDDAELLLGAEGPELHALQRAADLARTDE